MTQQNEALSRLAVGLTRENLGQPAEAQVETTPGLSGGLDLAAIQGRVADINTVIDSLMVKDVHYGEAFPNSGRDSLLQPGAELMFMAFGMVPDPEPIEERLDGGHLRVVCQGQVTSADGRPMGRITAECSTMEPKYRYRFASRTCPACGLENIRMSKRRESDPPAKKMGYYCWPKTGGCGATFTHDDKSIVEQVVGKVEHEDPEELWHTVRMMSQKRWLVALARRTFSLSARFVDQQAAQEAAFDVKRLAPILRSLPGDRESKWSEVVAFALQRFAKAPRELTCLEGSVVLQWLGSRVDTSSTLTAADFGESPEIETAVKDEEKPEKRKASGGKAASEPTEIDPDGDKPLPVALISSEDLDEVKALLKKHAKIFAEVNRNHDLGIAGGPSKIPAHRVEEVCIAIRSKADGSV